MHFMQRFVANFVTGTELWNFCMPSCMQVCSAMFDGLSRGMERAVRLIGKDATLTPENVKEPLKEVRVGEEERKE